MPTTKRKILTSLKNSIANSQKTEADQRFALTYLKRWAAAFNREHDEWDVIWHAEFLERLYQRRVARETKTGTLIGKLFTDCGLSRSNPADVDVLLAGLAQSIYPEAAGAKQKWGPEKYEELDRDIKSIEDAAARKNADRTELDDRETAEAILKSKGISAKYDGNKRGSDSSMDADSLRKRIGQARNAGLGLNPSLVVWDFWHTVRGDPAMGPPRAQDLPVQPPFAKGSDEAARAAALESKLTADAQRFFAVLDIYIPETQELWIRLCARRIARQSVRQNVQLAKKSDS